MKPTIKDIAKKLGVSATAVSKALNNRADVSEDLKKKVKKVAEELNYKPNSIAQRLVNQKSKTIGLFLLTRYKVNPDNNFGYKFFGGIIEEANNKGYDIVLFSIDSDTFDKKTYLELCEERRVEAAIFIGLGMGDKNLESLKKSDIPIALIDGEYYGNNLSMVTTDGNKGVKLAIEEFLKNNHKKIAMICGHEQAFVSKERFSAYKEIMKENKLYRDDYVLEGYFTGQGAYEAGLKILEIKDRPTAVFAASDLMAIGAIRAFKDRGIKVPEEISVIGFDNDSIGEFVEPRLTTIAQDPIAMGREAVITVVNMIEKKDVAKKIVLKPEIILRESCVEIKEEV